MAVYGGPDIVTDGLVLHLDAANNKSYPGSGNTWFDLSGNKNNGTLTNGPTYSSTNSGSLIFDGVDDLCRTTLPVSVLETLFTACIFFNLSSVKNQGGSVDQRLISADRILGSTKWCIGVNNNSKFVFGGSGGIERVGFDINLNTNYFVAITHNITTYSIWLNNTIQINNDTSNISTNGSFGNISIACRPNSTDRLWVGSIFVCSIYNRLLTPQEIQQNYNALKGRFGL